MSLLARRSISENVQVEKYFTVHQTSQEIVIEFDLNCPFEDFSKAIDILMEGNRIHSFYQYDRPICIYREPAIVYHRGKYKEVTEFQCKFFRSENHWCYSSTPKGRSGYYVKADLSWNKIQKIVVKHESHDDYKKAKQSKMDKLLKKVEKARYDEQTWSGLSADTFTEDNHPFYSIDKVFNRYDMEAIERAFAEKKQFSFGMDSKNRRYHVEGHLGKDGVYRAWFAITDQVEREYTYFLLNPKTAVFRDID